MAVGKAAVGPSIQSLLLLCVLLGRLFRNIILILLHNIILLLLRNIILPHGRETLPPHGLSPGSGRPHLGEPGGALQGKVGHLGDADIGVFHLDALANVRTAVELARGVGRGVDLLLLHLH